MPPKRRIETSFVAFDVTYVDGTRSSNRRVPSAALTGLDGDLPAQAILEQQDAGIGAASGKSRPAIKSVARSPVPDVVKPPTKAPAKARPQSA